MRSVLLLLLISATSAQAPCGEPLESMHFAIYRIAEGERSLIAEGTREYTSSDIEVVPWGKEIDGYQERRKALALADGFGIGIVTIRHHENDGFGLWIYKDHHPAGFSWEWFSRGDGGVFTKLQGKGYVRVTYTQIPKGVEIRSVEFLTDITMRFKDNLSLPTALRTHEVVISKGSVFRVAP